jgi:hypothetical protein
MTLGYPSPILTRAGHSATIVTAQHFLPIYSNRTNRDFFSPPADDVLFCCLYRARVGCRMYFFIASAGVYLFPARSSSALLATLLSAVSPTPCLCVNFDVISVDAVYKKQSNISWTPPPPPFDEWLNIYTIDRQTLSRFIRGSVLKGP